MKIHNCTSNQQIFSLVVEQFKKKKYIMLNAATK